MTREAEDAYLVVTRVRDADARLQLAVPRTSAEARAVRPSTSPPPTRCSGVMGPRSARAARRAHATPICRRRPSRSAPRASSTSATPGCAPAASPTWASSAGSSTCRPSSRRASTTRIVAAGEPYGLRTPATTPWTRCASRRPTGTGATTSADEDTPLEAGLGFAVRLDKPGGFIGREALLRAARARRCRGGWWLFTLERPEPLLYHDEPIWRDGALVGKTSSGMYGHTLGAPLALGYVARGGEASPRHGSPPDTTRSRSPPSGSRHACRSSRSTILRVPE